MAVVEVDFVARYRHLAHLDSLAERADVAEAAGLSASTRRAYASDWAHFVAFCERYELQSLPADPETVRLYVTELGTHLEADGTARYRPATIARRVSAITRAHRDAGHPGFGRHPRVAPVLSGVRRQLGTRPRRARPILLDELRDTLAVMDHATWPAGLAAARDRFALLAGFAGALRRSELASLTVSDIHRVPADGLHLYLRVSKTDQEQAGATLALPYGTNPATCPPCAWAHWARILDAWTTSGRTGAMRQVLRGQPAHADHVCRDPLPAELDPDLPAVPVLRRGGTIDTKPITGAGICAMLQRRVSAAGADPSDIGAHSLRAGFVTQARRNGADTRAIRLQSRHHSDTMVDVYDREWVPLAGNAVTVLGL